MTNTIHLIWTSLLAYAIIQGILLFLLFPTFRQGRTQAKWLLAVLSLLSALVLTEDFVSSEIGYDQYPHLIFAFSPVWYALGPILYLYIRLYVDDKDVQWIDLWHFIPVMVVFANTLNFYQLPAETKLYYLQNIQKGDIHPIHNLNYLIFCAQCVVYLGIGGTKLWKHRSLNLPNGEFRWLSQLVATLGVITVQSVFTLIVFNSKNITGWTSTLYYTALIVFLTALVIRIIRFPKTLYLAGRPPVLKFNTVSNRKDFDRIEIYMQEQKPYSDPEYDIQNLASQLTYSKHYIRQLIKEHTQLSFRDYMNQFRIEEAKRRLRSPESKQFTIESIANESGFNSQATFYRVFKKVEGTTPKSFIG